MKRGDIITIVLQGNYGKPRPALVIQSDLFQKHPSVTVLPLTGHIRDTPIFRIQVEPSAKNGLQKSSQIMIDKAQTVSTNKIGSVIGNLEDKTVLVVTRALAVFLGFA